MMKNRSKNISRNKVEKIKEKSIEKFDYLFKNNYFIDPGIRIVQEVAFKKLKYLKTGFATFDELLGGGFPRGLLSEISGVSGSGKTQLCLQLLSEFCHSNIHKNSTRKALFIDTENSFYSLRLREILSNIFNVDGKTEIDDLLNNIYVINIINSNKFLKMVASLHDILLKDDQVRCRYIKLIIIDSIAAPFWNYQGESSSRTHQIVHCATTLIRIAEIFRVIIIVTNRIKPMVGKTNIISNSSLGIISFIKFIKVIIGLIFLL
ncbi:hypothetical protein MXB_4031 [Myxobolus squamalis]|nr:hypothetical protein MXB_4031 [Myxobolus squamalis]